MSPEDLFKKYSDQADKVAIDLCHYYAVSGALAYQDEAISEARLGLWKAASRYDPRKQRMQRKIAEEAFYAELLGIDAPPVTHGDPFATFWLHASRYVRGGVLDFFRSQKLIHKLPKAEEGQEPVRTMLYYHRYVSLSRKISDVSGDSGQDGDSFENMLPSSSRTDEGDHMRDVHVRLSLIRDGARLTAHEKKVLTLCFSDHDHSIRRVAKMLKWSETRVKKTRDGALHKMRQSAETSLLARHDRSRSDA